jgi:hypothetical protein
MGRMTQPVRLRLSRVRGFDLQALSHETNGLPAVNVARPGKWGNPFKVGSKDRRTGGTLDPESAVERYSDALVLGRLGFTEASAREALRGENLACWCAPDAPCHADVLIELANR